MGERVVMQGDGAYWTPKSRWPSLGGRVQVPGTISQEEHDEIWLLYDAKWKCGQSSKRIAERGGFSYWEAAQLLGHEPTTWLAAESAARSGEGG